MEHIKGILNKKKLPKSHKCLRMETSSPEGQKKQKRMEKRWV